MSIPSWGHDPLLRWLRALAVVAFLGMLVVVILDPDKADNAELLVLLFGSILIALGYPVVMNLPHLLGPKEVEDRLNGKPEKKP